MTALASLLNVTTDAAALADALVVQLDAERRAVGMTLDELGARVGLSTQTMQRYLTRKERDLPVRILLAACDAVGVPFADLVESAEKRANRAS